MVPVYTVLSVPLSQVIAYLSLHQSMTHSVVAYEKELQRLRTVAVTLEHLSSQARKEAFPLLEISCGRTFSSTKA